MKKLMFLFLIMLFAVLLASCSPGGASLKPDVKIGDMEFITEHEYTPAELEEAWRDSTWSMAFEGRPVDLQTFGSSDVTHPQYGPMRRWNVVIAASAPSLIAAYSKGSVNDTPFEGSTTFSFIAP